MNCTRQLTVLKIIICDILFSLVDNFTDIMQVNFSCQSEKYLRISKHFQGLNLLCGDFQLFEAETFHLISRENYWTEK